MFPLAAHGRRARYVAGCRCALCREANRLWRQQRDAALKAGARWNGYLDASAVRAHLLALQQQGVGTRAIAATTDLGRQAIQKLRDGRSLHVRAVHAARILAVDSSCIADHAFVSARRSWRQLRQLLKDGYPARRLSHLLGYAADGLQFGARQITARNALKIDQLYRRLRAESQTA